MSGARALDQAEPPAIAVDNTFLGPLWQSPLELGADLVLYSLTKYVGGHSDLIMGSAAVRSPEVAKQLALGMRDHGWTVSPDDASSADPNTRNEKTCPSSSIGTRYDGRPCTWTQAAIRSVLRLLEVNPICVGALPAALVIVFSVRQQRLGDMLAHTLVEPV